MTQDQFQTLAAELAQVRRQGERTERAVQAVQQELAQTRQDLEGKIAGTREDLRLEITQTRNSLREDLRQEIAQTRDSLREDLRQEIAEAKVELRQEIGETRDRLQNRIDDLHRHFDVVGEELRGQIQLVAEGLISLGERMEARMAAERRETAAELAEIKALIRFSYTDLDRRVTRLEGTH